MNQSKENFLMGSFELVVYGLLAIMLAGCAESPQCTEPELVAIPEYTFDGTVIHVSFIPLELCRKDKP